MDATQLKIGFAMCGSFCTFSKAIEQMKYLAGKGYDITPILSPSSAATDTRFGKAADFIKEVTQICGKEPITTIVQAEPIGPKKMFDALLVAPCTGNTLAKLANGITDTCVTMAVKSHLRNARPAILGVSTNDALGAAAKNIGLLMNAKNIYFVPMKQDNPQGKPNSVVADFSKAEAAILAALQGYQAQPLFV